MGTMASAALSVPLPLVGRGERGTPPRKRGGDPGWGWRRRWRICLNHPHPGSLREPTLPTRGRVRGGAGGMKQ